jgi:CRISPR/Cas system CSM-associated protein Csm3 (group 7 of RAMP superfamily)
LQLHSPLHIGSETRLNTDADRPLLKDIDGWPYIPATSIKGALRHWLEQLLSNSAATPRAEGMAQPLTDAELKLAQQTDVVTQLFGSPWMESRLRFSNLVLTNRNTFLGAEAAPTSTRVGVGMNARRRVARDEVLYSTELFAPGVPLQFRGSVTAYTNEEQTALIIGALQTLIHLGSGRSRGLGWCKVVVEAPQYTPEQLRSLLSAWFGSV